MFLQWVTSMSVNNMFGPLLDHAYCWILMYSSNVHMDISINIEKLCQFILSDHK